MKKIFAVFLFAILLILPSTLALASTLQMGSTGAEVKTLQTKLNITADGNFGPATEKALKAYQTKNGLTADGILGPTTASKLGITLPVDTPEIKAETSAGTVKLDNPLGTDNPDIPTILGRVIRNLVAVVGALAFAVFIYGGFQIMFSPGNPDGVKKGKSAIIYAALGLLIIFSSYAVVSFLIKAITK